MTKTRKNKMDLMSILFEAGLGISATAFLTGGAPALLNPRLGGVLLIATEMIIWAKIRI